MKLFAIFGILFVACVVSAELESEWESYKAKYGKHYATPADDAFRKAIFVKNYHMIEEHNKKYEAGESSFTMGLNNFSDMTEEEFKHYLGYGHHPVADSDLEAEWESYKAQYGKNYPDPAEDAFRKAIFVKNYHMIEEHNKKYHAGEVTWEMGLNNFSDWTEEEIKERLLGVRQPVADSELQSEWEAYKAKFEKHYATPAEDAFRKAIFVKNYHMVEEHNKKYEAGESSFTMGLNNFSDWTEEEIKERLLGLRQPVADSELQSEWEAYKAKFEKHYDTPAEDAFRKAIFVKNYRMIEEHNKKYEAGQSSYKMGLNLFTDMTEEEIKHYLDGIRQPVADSELQSEWEAYKAKFEKSYPDPAEDAFRKAIFVKNYHKIEEHNKKYEAGQSSYKMGLNVFSDKTEEEIKHYLGFLHPSNN